MPTVDALIDPQDPARLAAAFGVANLAVGGVMLRFEGQMRAAGGPGIIPFELAGSTERCDAIVARWGEDGRRAALGSLRLDFAYLATYAPLLAVLVAAAGGPFARPLARAQLVAGACDAVENTALLVFLAGRARTRAPQVARTAALAKFALLGAGVTHAALALATR